MRYLRLSSCSILPLTLSDHIFFSSFSLYLNTFSKLGLVILLSSGLWRDYIYCRGLCFFPSSIRTPLLLMKPSFFVGLLFLRLSMLSTWKLVFFKFEFSDFKLSFFCTNFLIWRSFSFNFYTSWATFLSCSEQISPIFWRNSPWLKKLISALKSTLRGKTVHFKNMSFSL